MMNCSRKPSTKTGMAMTTSETKSTVASKIRPFFRPAIRPKTMPKTASKQQGQHRQAHGDREDLRQDFGHGTAGEVVAQVKGQQVLQILEVLHDEGLVQVVLFTQLRGDYLVDRPVPEQRGDRVSGE